VALASRTGIARREPDRYQFVVGGGGIHAKEPALLKNQSNVSTQGSLGELAACIASRLARNGAAPSDLLGQGAFPLGVDGLIEKSDRLDENTAAIQVASHMPHDRPPETNPTSGEYRIRADACLHWAGEAPSDEVRLACLTLATAWFKAAIDQGGEASDHVPMVPRV
jgi:hypothetical protein